MKTDILPILVGLSLCGASAALLYIWYKTKEEDTVDSPGISPTKVKRETKLECVVPNNIVPLVVGRSGANVNAIEHKTGTVIRFREKDENNQICEITGFIENVQKAAALVKQEASPLPNITEKMYVTQSACGKIIGRYCESLQQVCRKSKTKIHISAGDRGDGNTRLVLITGTKAHVNIAKSLIEEQIRKDFESRKYLEKREPRGSPRNPDSIYSSNSSLEIVPPKMEKLSTNNTDGQLEVYVSAIASPSRFWLQLIGPQSLELDQLVESMTKYYNIKENQKLHKIADPYLGQIVTAMFKYDDKWYRAEIVGILPNEFNPRDVVLDLYFVDFGDSEYVAPHEVFELRTDFLTLRFQAIECFLAHVKPANGNDSEIWNSQAISRFEELTHVAKWKKMLSRVVTTKERKHDEPIRREGSPVPGVELYCSEGDSRNIAQELVKEGFALDDYSDSNHRSDEVLRLDGGDAGSNLPSPSTTKNKTIPETINKNANQNGELNDINLNTTNSLINENDRFTAICENTTNENYENTKADTRNQSNSFINSENDNGNVPKTSHKLLNRNTNDLAGMEKFRTT